MKIRLILFHISLDIVDSITRSCNGGGIYCVLINCSRLDLIEEQMN